MSEERSVDVCFMLEQLLRLEIDKGRMTHEEVLNALSIALGTFIADLPQRARRLKVLDYLRTGLERDTDDLVKERQFE